jgi:uncharacterized Zn finger protein (UPF0148 family)
VNNTLRWLNWTPARKETESRDQSRKIEEMVTDVPPKVPKHSRKGSSVSSVRPSGTISHIFQASDQTPIIEETNYAALSKPTLPKCIRCNSYALYRNQDGSVECMTCGPSVNWQNYPFKREKQ